MMYMLIPMLVLNIFTYFWMSFFFLGLFRPNSEDAKMSNLGDEGSKAVRKVVVEKVQEIGTITVHEILVTLCFTLTICLLFFRKPGFMDGWGRFFEVYVCKNLRYLLFHL